MENKTPPTTPRVGTPLAASPQSLLEANAYNDAMQAVAAMAALTMSSPQKSKATSTSNDKVTFKANRACWSAFVGSGGGHAMASRVNCDGVHALSETKTPKAIKRGRCESSSLQSESSSLQSESSSLQTDGGSKFRK